MTTKQLFKILEEVENQYYEYSSPEAGVQQVLIIARQDELKKLSYDRVCNILKALMNNIRTYLGKYVEDYEIFDMLNFDTNNKIYNFMLNMEL